MDKNRNYHLSLLCFCHILINVDNNVDQSELNGIEAIVKHEGISQDIYDEFQDKAHHLPEQDLFNLAVEGITSCNHSEKLRAFAWLYKLSEADGNVHDKEIKFILFSIKYAGIKMDDAIESASKLPAIV